MKQTNKLNVQLLPVDIRQSRIIYNEELNMFFTTGYTSQAGNTYYTGFKMSEKIIITRNIGIGHTHNFINELAIYSILPGYPKLLVKKSFHCKYYQQFDFIAEAKLLLKAKMLSDARNYNASVDEQWLNGYVASLVEGTYKNQLETLKSLVLKRRLN